MTHARLAQADADADAAAFDLRDLAFPPSGADGHDPAGRLADPFGVLGIAGIAAPARGDVLAALLGEAVPSTADRDPDRRRAADAVPVPTPVDADSGAQAAVALLDRLHEEFVRVVRDPTRLAGRADWQGAQGAEGVPASDAAPAPTPDEDGRRAASVAPLLDIVRSRRTIDEVLETFDPLGQAPSLDMEPRPDVLHLFAPEIVRGARAPLPGLTRREHHAVSPDSPMPPSAPSAASAAGAANTARAGDGEAT